MTDWNKIRKEWETSDITFVDLAKKHDLKASTIRSRKNREKWQRNATNVATNKNNATKKKEPIAEEVSSVLENKNLTDKQRLFCVYYIKYFNATKAYQKAYECDYITANTNGPRLLVNACIKDEINRLKQGKLNRAMFSAEDLFQMYLDIATADMNDFMEYGQEEVPYRAKDGTPLLDDDGNEVTYTRNYVYFKNNDEVDGALINEISLGQSGAKVKLHDKMKALEWLEKNVGLASEEQKLRIKKLKADIERIQGNEEELEKLDKILERIDDVAKS